MGFDREEKYTELENRVFASTPVVIGGVLVMVCEFKSCFTGCFPGVLLILGLTERDQKQSVYQSTRQKIHEPTFLALGQLHYAGY